jgi:hypothetical protein
MSRSIASVQETTVEPFKPYQTRMPDPEFVLIEMFGGHNNLSSFVYEDLQEVAAGIKGSKIALIGLAAVANKPACVVEVTPTHGIQLIENLGQIDTGDPETLMNFLVRALMTYPNARKAIGFWDHGSGVFDETDSQEKILSRQINSVLREDRSRSRPARRLFFPKSRTVNDFETRGMLHDDTTGGVLTNLEAGAMLASAYKVAGFTGKVDLIFSDTCLNGMIEVLDEIGIHAKCVVASSDLEPGDGWDYQRWLAKTADKPPATAEEWGAQAVEAFREGYEPFPKKFPCTLAAFKSDHKITPAFAGLIQAARKEGGFETFFFLDHARSKAQGFAQRDTYDMRDFAEKVVAITQGNKPEMAAAARNVVAAYDAAKVSSCALGKAVEQSTGLSFYFPASRSQMTRDIGTYEKLAFSRNSGWAEFLKEFR